MSEQHKSSSHERTGEISNAEIHEHNERMKAHHESAAERARDKAQEREAAHYEAKELAKPKEDYKTETEKPKHTELPHTKAEKDHGFDTIMHHVRQNMSKPERAFSGFIHKPVIEKTSEVLGKTVARPSGIAGATIAAFIGLLSIYSIAKFAGFSLSGSEMPLLLAAGFAIGLFAEWAFKSVRVIAAPKKS